jgi:polyhydroxybutyrate depolymerase
MKTIFRAAALVTLCAAIAAAESAPASGCAAESIVSGRRIERTVEVAGVPRNFILDVPETITAGTTVPVLFDFHGWGHSGPGVWKVSKFRDFAPAERFITVYPDGLPVSLRGGEARPGWEIRSVDGNRDVAFTQAMLEILEREYCIDRSRIYSTGFSNGAFFSNLLACAMPETFAAIAPVGGGRITVPCAPKQAVPVLFHHGTQDEVVPLAGAVEARDRWVSINECREAKTEGACEHHTQCRDGAEVVFCSAEVAHTWPPEATRRIWDFVQRWRR